ncbi:MAG: HigA family addiction module antidote protein [Oceanicoccus sp.]|uniref:HigA family addiction module antitoxin n=1 Tax=Oceanicoccus sp. TaxID=2691044 RepID=UPI0026061457|nr:HigA family addiction module antitoxin [Oceanicoccus sp.]MCP3909165.1 HigA family addiction module antidote protein [Oceanicoccus sp.]
MIPLNRTATHPGIILLKEFLEPLKLTQKALAKHVGVPVQRINEIIRGKRGITPETAWLLAEAFNTSPEFWLNLQASHDLSANRPDHHVQSLVAVGI